MKKFWNWKKKAVNLESGQEAEERILFMNGVIAEDSWFDDDVTPALFKDELNAGTGDITLWINSPGGDCVAAAQIFNMLSEYPGKVTVKIDGLAASAASVIAMAGTEVWMSPVSMMMIHNPATVAWGDHSEMKKAMELLDAVKESTFNVYLWMENGRGTVDVGDCIASVSGQAMAAGEAWDGKLEVEDYTTRFAIGGGLDVNVFRESLSMQMKETVNRGFEVYFAERAGISGFCRPVEMEGV